MNTTYYTDSGSTIHLEQQIGKGGEGIVYQIHEDKQKVAKIYIKQQPSEVHQKILVMVANPPHDPTIHGPTKHHSMAWPLDVLYADRQKLQFAGFIMPFIDTRNFQKILDYLNLQSRKQNFNGSFTWLHLHVTARNLASCIAAIHDKGHCIGDLNESNVLVQRSTPLTIIDCDSFQVRDASSGRVLRCTVGKPEYTAPEIMDSKYSDVDRTLETDCFALGVMLFQLLMEGFHPYSSRGPLVNNAPNSRDKIKLGIFPYNTSLKGIDTPEDAPPFDILAPEIRALFVRCFDAGHKNPSVRPTAKEWMSALDRLAPLFNTCKANSNHRYLPHLPFCPWCDRLSKLGERFHSFPIATGIGMQFRLPDPTNQIGSKQEREAFLLTFIETALIDDGYVSPTEEAHLIDLGLKLNISEKETKRLIADEIKKKGITPSAGSPRLSVTKKYFPYEDIKNGDILNDVIEINNVGDGILTGTLASNVQWIKVQGSIAPNRKNQSQKLPIVIDTSSLPYGFSGTGTVSIKTNGGDISISVSLSTKGLSVLTAQFRKSYVPLVAAFFGFIGSFSSSPVSNFLAGAFIIGIIAYAFAKQFVNVSLNKGIDIFKFPPIVIQGAAAGVVLLTIMSHSGSGSHNRASSYTPPPVQTAAPAPAPVPAPAPAPVPEPTRPSIQITTAVVAEGLDANQIPFHAATHFPSDKKRLYYYVSFKDAIPNSTVLVFYWWYQGNQIGTSQATPTSVTGNAWNYVDYNFQPGQYEVQVEANGQRLVSTSFTVIASVARTQDIWEQQRQQAVERQQAAYNQQQLENQQRAEQQRQQQATERERNMAEYRQRQLEAQRRAEEAERQQRQAAYSQQRPENQQRCIPPYVPSWNGCVLENQQRTNGPPTERRSFSPPSGSLRDE